MLKSIYVLNCLNCSMDYGKLRINKFIYEIQDIKHNSLRHDGYIFTSYFFPSSKITRTKYEANVINVINIL